jgi:hypothetical protein
MIFACRTGEFGGGYRFDVRARRRNVCFLPFLGTRKRAPPSENSIAGCIESKSIEVGGKAGP